MIKKSHLAVKTCKSNIHRRLWNSKNHLLLQNLSHLLQAAVEISFTYTVSSDLINILSRSHVIPYFQVE